VTARLRTSDGDSGASLIIAMIFVTLVGMVSGVLLSFADTGVDTTIQLRKQATEATTADGAAEVAIDALREGSYSNATGQSCFGSSNGLALSNFPSTGTGSAFVACSPDEGSGSKSTGSLNASNTPANAILSLGGISSSESGVQVTATAASNAMVVKGGVFSDSAITVTPGTLRSDTSIVAQSNLCNPASAMVSPNTNCVSSTPLSDPGYAPLVGSLTAPAMPTCSSAGGLATFSPGLYTSATTLSSCDNNTMWFKPGVYYFNFPFNKATWTMDTGALVGGTPTTTLTGATPVMPGSCESPLTSTSASGVQFIFGGYSALDIRGTAKVELCGSYSSTAPPIAVYGLKSAVGTVPAETGCITTVAGCPLLSSSDSALTSAMYVQGTVYAPRALVALSYGQSGSLATGQYVKDGIIARSISASLSGVSPTGVEVAPQTLGPKGAETDVFLQVYVCPGVATCSAATGRLRLESKVGVSTAIPVVPGARSVRVYSWATQR
jgi:hypothetical protein